MKKLLSTLVALCMLVCMAIPTTVQAADLTDAVNQFLDSGAPEETSTIGNSGDISGNGALQPAAPSDISVYSDFGNGDMTFMTQVRLTTKDRNGNTIAGAIYGLYKSDGTLVQELVTNKSGVAVSDDIAIDTNYYLEELYPPEGFQSNMGRQEIVLTEVCAPSLIDVSAEYDPIMGRIKVIKTDENGNTLSGMSFIVYRTSDGTQVDDIAVGEDGTATTIDLPYGEYGLAEYNVPDGFASSKDYYISIVE